MRKDYLLPYRAKKIGWIILIPSGILGLLFITNVFSFDFLDSFKLFAIYNDEIIRGSTAFTIIQNNPADEVLGILCIVGALMVAFSREKDEDEYMARLRAEALILATTVNYIILAFSILFFYGFAFFLVLVFNMYTLLVLFIVIFKFRLYRIKKI